MDAHPFEPAAFEACAAEIVEVARELGGRGFAPATSGNFSRRLDDAHIAITRSGEDKARLSRRGVMVVDLEGRPVEAGLRPSAETRLHVQIYRRLEHVGCVLHTHSPAQTLVSRLFSAEGRVCLQGWELLKALDGIDTHEAAVEVPIVPNSQDMDELCRRAADHLVTGRCPGYLIAGHGLYAWGRDLAAARRHLEAFEFLLSTELEWRRLR